MDDKDLAILRMVNKARMEAMKACEKRLIELEKDLLNEMGISREDFEKEWEKRYGFPKPKGDD